MWESGVQMEDGKVFRDYDARVCEGKRGASSVLDPFSATVSAEANDKRSVRAVVPGMTSPNIKRQRAWGIGSMWFD